MGKPSSKALEAAREILSVNIASGDVDEDTALITTAGLMVDIAEAIDKAAGDSPNLDVLTTVHVVCLNDFPDKVFLTKGAASSYMTEQRAEPDQPGTPRKNWHMEATPLVGRIVSQVALIRAADSVLNYIGMGDFLDDHKIGGGQAWGVQKNDLLALRAALVGCPKAESLRRMWINQPSGLQPLHALHGTPVLAQPDTPETYRVWHLAGEVISQQVPRNALSEGWPKHLVGDDGALVEALKWYANPANWWTDNSSGPGIHQMGNGSVEHRLGRPGSFNNIGGSETFIPDAGRRAKRALEAHAQAPAGVVSHEPPPDEKQADLPITDVAQAAPAGGDGETPRWYEQVSRDCRTKFSNAPLTPLERLGGWTETPLYAAPPAPATAGDFAVTGSLRENIEALIELDEKGRLTPHGIGGLARGLFREVLALRNAAKPGSER